MGFIGFSLVQQQGRSGLNLAKGGDGLGPLPGFNVTTEYHPKVTQRWVNWAATLFPWQAFTQLTTSTGWPITRPVS